MAENRDGGRRDASGAAGGTDVEPLRGGMAEQDRKEGRARKGSVTTDDPAAPYHAARLPEEDGLVPRGRPGPEGGSTPREGTPPDPGEAGESARGQDKIAEERRDLENDAANAPRHDPR
jgi:hypothetical protein